MKPQPTLSLDEFRAKSNQLHQKRFAVHGEPTDGVDDPRKCRFCEDGIGRRIR